MADQCAASPSARVSSDKKLLHFEHGAEEVQLLRREFDLAVPMRKDTVRVRLPFRSSDL